MIAVLDWELSTTGQPLTDFAYFLMHHYWPEDMTVGGMGSLKGTRGEDEHREAAAVPFSSLPAP